MYDIQITSRFKKDLKTAIKRGYSMESLNNVVDMLASGQSLPEKNKDHFLSGNWSNYRECHVAPDWLLIYKIENDILVLTLVRTGTHSDLF
ncbi:type II toxin-antitoxin system YafQ family toxin [Anaerotignum sp.]|uniref:type II toxin-antitoxin system YafQ family toxin n=1 Tax=Anaerotignum sp. TaxID=2039241 RepID=UPI0028AFF255|nr:type II toxin-antitoxin system YafQ family toxin [Anaerotignum sp.]